MPKPSRLIKACQEGEKAFNSGQQLSDNPYGDEPIMHSQWMGGFMIASVAHSQHRHFLVNELVQSAWRLQAQHPTHYDTAVQALLSVAEQNSI